MIESHPISIEKSLGEGRFSGLAWSLMDTPDREGDCILPSALESVVRSGRMPEIRVEHRKADIAGVIESMLLTDRGLEVVGLVDTRTAIGTKAYDGLRSRSLGALSMGFEGVAQKSGSVRIFTEISLTEISLCREPMNAGSRVHAIKSWGEVASQRDLERLLHDVAGMPNRLARKSAEVVWPSISETDPDEAAFARLADRIARLTQSVTN